MIENSVQGFLALVFFELLKKGVKMHVIAHRGSCTRTTENSWSAFKQAIASQCHRIEMDLQFTKDKNIIIMHDDLLDRTCLGKGRADSYKSDELESILLKNKEKIPYFSEILDQILPHIEINAEIKGNDEELALKAAEMVSELNLKGKVIFSCFYPAPLRAIKNKFPELKTAVLWGLDTLKINPVYFFFPLLFLKKCQTNIFHPEAEKLSMKLMKKLKENEIQVNPWVPMSGEKEGHCEKLWQNMLKLQIDGLCTNQPEKLIKWLDAQSEFRKV